MSRFMECEIDELEEFLEGAILDATDELSAEIGASADGRTAVSSCGAVLGSSGSYVLTANMECDTGTNAISITADDVTLDLKGFTVSQTTETGSAIVAYSQNVTVRNGTLRGYIGLQVPGGSAEVLDMRILDGRHGVVISGGAEIVVRNSILRGAGEDAYTSDSFAVKADDSDLMLVQGNLVADYYKAFYNERASAVEFISDNSVYNTGD